MTQHSPGPWVAYNSDNGRILKHWRIRGDCVRDDPPFATINSNGKILAEYEAANARLIAAAPELLAACQEALRCRLMKHHGADPLLAQLRAAIAKATGSTFASDDPVDEADYEGTGCGRADFDNELCCQRCGSELCDVDGHCRDETCPFSDRTQDEKFIEA